MFSKSAKFLWVLWLIFSSSLGNSATTLVAVASNFTKPMTEIAEAFEKATGHSTNLAFGSSGKFVAQLGKRWAV